MNSNDKTQLGSGSSNYYYKADQLQVGTLIDNRYEIKEKLGSGGFGTVYKVWDEQLELDKAIKVIHPDFYDEEMVMEKLKEETRLMMRLNIKEVVRVYDVYLQGEMYYIAMEYIDGQDLLKLMAKRKKLPESEVLAIAGNIASGMAQVHAENILHLDLKPANVRITSRGQVKIMDFGIAKALKTASKSRLNETSKSGTLAYMSPEQLIGLNVGKESDIWSFGIMVYQLLTGDLLYNAPSFRDLDFQMEKRPFVGDEALSEMMNRLLKGCLAYDYKMRFRTFEEVLGAIQSSEKKPIVEIKEPQFEPEKRQESKSVTPKEITNSIGMELVLIPAGKFMMGSNDGYSDEQPVHEVTISQPFYMGKYEVTQKEFKVFVDETGYKTEAEKDGGVEIWNGSEWEQKAGSSWKTEFVGMDRPVVGVSWNDVQEFINWLNQKEGGNSYRLPTEAEWEYACRAGTSTKWSFGDSKSQLGEYAWYGDNSDSQTHPVGQKKPNGFGLYDMHGNVWEWCSDGYDDEYYEKSPTVDPLGPDTGSLRVGRGGSWISNAENARSAIRLLFNAEYGSNLVGFRLVRLR